MNKFVVRYLQGVRGKCHSNIVWEGEFAMARGRFPADHPCAASSQAYVAERNHPFGSDQFGSGPALDAFRALGYWASCFPEGDGITMSEPEGKTRADVVSDIEATFGWTVAKTRRGKEPEP